MVASTNIQDFSYWSIASTAVLSTLMISYIATLFNRTRFVAGVFFAFLAIMVCASYGVFISIFFGIIGYHGLSQWSVARFYSGIMSPLLGLYFDVENEGRLLTRPAVFISNHQTDMDVLVLGRLFPKYCSVTSKKELKRVPFLGWFMMLSGTVFIDRANRQNAVATFDTAVKQIQSKNQSVWIFPEGTRSNFTDPDLLPFKKGAFHLAIQADVDIVPVVIGNYSHLFNWKAQRSASGVCRVRVLEPISTKGLTAADVDGLAKRVREDMLKTLKEIHPTQAVQHSTKHEIEDTKFKPMKA